jgi:hypothetical protein
MSTVELTDAEWQSVITIIGNAPAAWTIVNPLLMKIGGQLAAQRTTGTPERIADALKTMGIRGNSNHSIPFEE